MAGAAGILPFAPMFFSMLQTRDPATVTTAVAVAVGLVYVARAVSQGGSSSRPSSRPRCATAASRWRCRCRRHRRRTGAAGRHVAVGYGGGDPATLFWYLSALGLVAIASAFFMQPPTRFALPAGARLEARP